jgi:hypothetical protein
MVGGVETEPSWDLARDQRTSAASNASWGQCLLNGFENYLT